MSGNIAFLRKDPFADVHGRLRAPQLQTFIHRTLDRAIDVLLEAYARWWTD